VHKLAQNHSIGTKFKTSVIHHYTLTYQKSSRYLKS